MMASENEYALFKVILAAGFIANGDKDPIEDALEGILSGLNIYEQGSR